MEESNLTEKDIFASKEVETKKEKKSNIPFHYTEVKFHSLGKLTTPSVLHFRNFSANEAAKIALTKDEDEYEVFIECLNDMVWEGFDCSELHSQELLTILYTLHATYFSDKIEKKYYIDETREDLNNPENIDTAEINISDLNTTTLAKEFKEPFTITRNSDGFKAQFIFPRIGFMVKAKKYLEEKYAKDIMDLHDVKQMIESALSEKSEEKRIEKYYSIPLEERLAYEKFQNKYYEEFTVLVSAFCIHKIGNKSPESIEERIEMSKQIDNTMLLKLNQVTENYHFGIDPEVKYYSVKQKKKLTRRFDFRIQDFLSDREQLEGDSRFDVSFD